MWELVMLAALFVTLELYREHARLERARLKYERDENDRALERAMDALQAEMEDFKEANDPRKVAENMVRLLNQNIERATK